MATILMPLPNTDFDPTESAIPWKLLSNKGHQIFFATPGGSKGVGDERMLSGNGLGIFASSLKAKKEAVEAYDEMEKDLRFQSPLSFENIDPLKFDGVLLPGGHAPGMKSYLESLILQEKVKYFFKENKPVGAICHGVVFASRIKTENKKSVLYGRKVTALPRWMELSAWGLTCLWLGNYYRTYNATVEAEVKGAVGESGKFMCGPLSLERDSMDRLERGFVVKDGNLITARWPGDAHRFSEEFNKILESTNTSE